eukprot:591353_1
MTQNSASVSNCASASKKRRIVPTLIADDEPSTKRPKSDVVGSASVLASGASTSLGSLSAVPPALSALPSQPRSSAPPSQPRSSAPPSQPSSSSPLKKGAGSSGTDSEDNELFGGLDNIGKSEEPIEYDPDFPSYRFSIPMNPSGTTVVDWEQLVREAEAQPDESEGVEDDELQSTGDSFLDRLASKYAPEDQSDDEVSEAGSYYDTDDSFIDDSDIVRMPTNITTSVEGFYVQMGAVVVKQIPSSTSSPPPKKSRTHHKSKSGSSTPIPPPESVPALEFALFRIEQKAKEVFSKDDVKSGNSQVRCPKDLLLLIDLAETVMRTARIAHVARRPIHAQMAEWMPFDVTKLKQRLKRCHDMYKDDSKEPSTRLEYLQWCQKQAAKARNLAQQRLQRRARKDAEAFRQRKEEEEKEEEETNASPSGYVCHWEPFEEDLVSAVQHSEECAKFGHKIKLHKASPTGPLSLDGLNLEVEQKSVFEKLASMWPDGLVSGAQVESAYNAARARFTVEALPRFADVGPPFGPPHSDRSPSKPSSKRVVITIDDSNGDVSEPSVPKLKTARKKLQLKKQYEKNNSHKRSSSQPPKTEKANSTQTSKSQTPNGPEQSGLPSQNGRISTDEVLITQLDAEKNSSADAVIITQMNGNVKNQVDTNGSNHISKQSAPHLKQNNKEVLNSVKKTQSRTKYNGVQNGNLPPVGSIYPPLPQDPWNVEKQNF